MLLLVCQSIVNTIDILISFALIANLSYLTRHLCFHIQEGILFTKYVFSTLHYACI